MIIKKKALNHQQIKIKMTLLKERIHEPRGECIKILWSKCSAPKQQKRISSVTKSGLITKIS